MRIMWGSFVILYLFSNPRTVTELADICKTPKHLGRWMWHNLRYIKDIKLYKTPEYWANPEETLSHRAGDCEDFAVLAQAVLREKGVEALIVGAYSGGVKKKGHASCVFYNNKKHRWYLIGTKGLRRGPKEFRDIPKHLIDDPKIYRVYNENKEIQQEYVLVRGIWRRIDM